MRHKTQFKVINYLKGNSIFKWKEWKLPCLNYGKRVFVVAPSLFPKKKYRKVFKNFNSFLFKLSANIT